MDRNNYPKLMKYWAKDLFPICRSITGQGLRETLNYFKKINPCFKKVSFKSGTKVFDWVIPDEWVIKDAYILNKKGQKIVDFKKNNLHVINYSSPINKVIKTKNLFKNIYTDKSNKNAIPYITSYYKKNWGFCMSENHKNKMKEKQYKILIDSKFKKGSLDLLHALIPGKYKKEIFISSYVCHPSMANNELSGPVLANAILKYIKNNFKNLKYSYRFVLLPETIGSIAYLSKFYKSLKKNVICGFNLSCVGDDLSYSHIKSRNSMSLADSAITASLIGRKNVKTYSFLERGSDERQYCSPGIDLPVCGFCRSKYGTYKEYHTSLDNLNFISEKGFTGSFDVIKNIVDSFENGLFPKTQVKCEPFLTKYGLYPEISRKENYNDQESRLRSNLIAYSDGKTSIFDISIKIKEKLSDINKELKKLKSKNIIKS